MSAIIIFESEFITFIFSLSKRESVTVVLLLMVFRLTSVQLLGKVGEKIIKPFKHSQFVSIQLLSATDAMTIVNTA